MARGELEADANAETALGENRLVCGTLNRRERYVWFLRVIDLVLNVTMTYPLGTSQKRHSLNQ